MQLHQVSIGLICAWVLLQLLPDCACQIAVADGPADNSIQTVRQIPPPGMALENEDRQELQRGLERLQTSLVDLRQSKNPSTVQYLPDVEILEKAVRIALTEDGFFDRRDIAGAKQLIQIGLERANELTQEVRPSWSGITNTNGFTVRGFRSKLDGSIQPYGIAWNQPTGRGDVWCRGRSEKGLELQFLLKQLTNPDPLPAAGVCMVYPLGRYCNANKLAGEVDTLEALEHAIGEYPIEEKQVAIRGFSMGGAATWHLAVHYPDKWFAATPGAGFSETPDFLRVFQGESLTPTPTERTLWHMYDCNKWAFNLKNIPTIAYSGAIDRQKQAADVMAEACWNLPAADRFELTHIVAPDTAHRITPQARSEIERRLSIIHSKRQWERTVPRIWFTTYTLKYNRCHWLTIDQLEQHWQPATVKAVLRIGETDSDNNQLAIIDIESSGLTQVTIDFEASQLPDNISRLLVNFNGDTSHQNFGERTVAQRSDLSFHATYRLNSQLNSWSLVSPLLPDNTLRKRHNLQGPIDDALMDSFLFVKPTAAGHHAATDHWVNTEMNRAVREWHRQMRGDVRVVNAGELQAADMKSHNIILWGDPQSNPQIAAIIEQLPIAWSADELVIGSHKFNAQSHVPAMIYPNPLAPNRYVVINSSFTYREYDYLNNARQVPKLPDWAIIDVRTAPDARWPGKIVAADFFGEHWELK